MSKHLKHPKRIKPVVKPYVPSPVHQDLQTWGPMVGQLLSMIPRLRWTGFIDDVQPEVTTKKNRGMLGWCVRKDYVQMPTEIPQPAHEIAHLVELKSLPRILMDDFDFVNGNTDISPAHYYVAMAREARVRAIQSHFDGRINFANPFWFEMAPRPFGKFRNEKDVEAWVHAIFTTARNEWNMDRIFHEMKIRTDYIRDYMETTT